MAEFAIYLRAYHEGPALHFAAGPVDLSVESSVRFLYSVVKYPGGKRPRPYIFRRAVPADVFQTYRSGRGLEA
jgi:hypothetical protein